MRGPKPELIRLSAIEHEALDGLTGTDLTTEKSMNEITELRDRQTEHAERLIRLETLIEQNQECLKHYEEDQRAYMNRYEEDQREARSWQKWTVTLMCGSWITLMAAILIK